MTTSAGPPRSAVIRDVVVQMWRRRLFSVFMFGLIVIVIFAGSRRDDFAMAWALCSAIVGLSMNVLVGYAGQISLAHAVLFGTGAFTMGNLVTVRGVPWLIALPLAGLVTALIALLIGFPALRIRGLNLAIATLGFQFAMQRVIFRAKFIAGGASGLAIERPNLFGLDTEKSTGTLMWIIFAVLVLVWMIDRNLTRSRAGRAFFALRQDEQVAASFGIPVARYKLLAFAISGFYAGLAGALFGTLVGDVTNELFDFTFSIEFLVFAVLGGLGSRGGTAIGGAFPIVYRRMFDFLRTTGALLGGILLVVTLLRYQGGIAAQGREFAHIAKTLARRGPQYFVGFLGAVAVSFGAAIALPFVVDAGLGLLGTNLPLILGIMGGIATSTVVLQVIVKRLFIIAGPEPQPAAAVDAESVEARALTHGISTTPSISFRRPASRERYSGPLLQIDGLTKIFGGVRALDGVSMEVREGELIGIMGPNGSGKTTLLNNISGFLTPNSGDIRVKGRSILGMGPHQRAALGLGRTFQNVGLVKQETVFDNFMIAQHLVCRYGPMEGLLRTGGVMREEQRLSVRAHAAIDLLDLKDIAGEQIRSLPHGLAKLVELGCALVTGPDILLLDEPAAGVSPQEADALGTTLRTIASNFGVTILMIEHHVPLMLSTCDYIYVLNFGQMLTSGEPADVAAHPDVIAAYLGTVGKEASRAFTASS